MYQKLELLYVPSKALSRPEPIIVSLEGIRNAAHLHTSSKAVRAAHFSKYTQAFQFEFSSSFLKTHITMTSKTLESAASTEITAHNDGAALVRLSLFLSCQTLKC